MDSPTFPGGVVDVDGVEVTVFPSTIIMFDAEGNQTADPALARSGEVIETKPDGSKRVTAFTA